MNAFFPRRRSFIKSESGQQSAFFQIERRGQSFLCCPDDSKAKNPPKRGFIRVEANRKAAFFHKERRGQSFIWLTNS